MKIAPTDAIWLFQCKCNLCPSLCGSPPPPSSTPTRLLVVLAIPLINYLKWWAIQLAIERQTIDSYWCTDRQWLASYITAVNCMQGCFPSQRTIFQIIKIRITKYLFLYMHWYMSTCMRACVCLHVCVSLCVYVSVCMGMCLHVCVCLCICVCVYMYVFVYVHVCI